MQISTKYSIGDTVWYMDKNNVVSSVVDNLVYERGRKVIGAEYNTFYSLSNNDERNEKVLFQSKEELLKSL